VHLVGVIITAYHNARSPERQIETKTFVPISAVNTDDSLETKLNCVTFLTE